MQDPVLNFVERMGLTLEAEGMPRIAGRLFGFLLVHEGAYCLDDLAEQLQVSKASVSTNARLLERIGLLERSSAPGDRRDYYQIGSDVWERMLRVAERRWETMRMLFTEAAASLPEEMDVGRKRLVQAEQFHLLLLDENERLLQRWRRRQENVEAVDGVAQENAHSGAGVEGQ